MRRQLRASGGITNARQGYGVGSWVKEKIRKIVPNELADLAVKAAPFVAPFQPGIAAAMRGFGRFDQRGSISDAVKQAGATYAFGKVANKGLSSIRTGAGGTGLPNTPSPPSAFNTNAAKQLATEGTGVGFESVSKATEFMKNIPIIGELPPLVQQQLLIGGVTSAGTYVYEKFLKEEPPKDEGETMEEYTARRKENVRIKMRNYFDSYFTFDKNYSSMTDEQKDAEVARYNKNQGGLMRRGYANGSGGITMTNTGAQNRQINDAQRQSNQSMLEAARARLPGYTPSSINFQSKLEQQDKFGGLPSGVGGNNIPARPSGQNTSQTYDPAPIPMLSEDYLSQLKDIRDQQTSSGMSGEDLIPEYNQYDMINLGPNQGALNLGGQQGQIDYLKQGVGQGLSYQQIVNNYNDEQYAKMQADDLKYGISADGKTVDSAIGRMMYNDLLNVVKYDQPNVTLTGNETLAELEKLAYPQYYNQGGRVGQNMGGLMRLKYMIGGQAKQMEAGAPPIMYSGNMDPNAPNQQAGLPSIPGPMQMAEDGPEFDMRENGGFQPLGRQEGKDDVPAMLAKNEFVMTADAVRAAGGGSIQKGAQKMYDTMKKLESRVS